MGVYTYKATNGLDVHVMSCENPACDKHRIGARWGDGTTISLDDFKMVAEQSGWITVPKYLRKKKLGVRWFCPLCRF